MVKQSGRIATYLITSSSDDTSSDTDTNDDSSSDTEDDEETDDTYVYYTEEAEELCNLINSERSSLGLSTLTITSYLTSAAEERAYDMAEAGYIYHDYSNGVNAGEIVISTSTSSASTAWSAIENSSSHYSIATREAAVTIGAACIYDGVGAYYWSIFVSFYE